MIEIMSQRAEAEETSEQKLWRAVIATTVEEWINGPLRQKRDAEQFLFHDDHDYRTVCYSAGIDPQGFRDRLHKIRSRQPSEPRTRVSRN
jgi:hypothetical protein